MAVWPPSSLPMAHGLPGSLGPATRVLFGPLRCDRPMGWMGGRYTTSKPMAATSGSRLRAARRKPPSERGNSSYQALNSARSRSTQICRGSVRVRSAGFCFFFCRACSSFDLLELDVDRLAGGLLDLDVVGQRGQAVGPGLDDVFVQAERGGLDDRLPPVVAQMLHGRVAPLGFTRRTPLHAGGEDVVAVAVDVGRDPHGLADHRLGRMPSRRARARVVDDDATDHPVGVPGFGSAVTLVAPACPAATVSTR